MDKKAAATADLNDVRALVEATRTMCDLCRVLLTAAESLQAPTPDGGGNTPPPPGGWCDRCQQWDMELVECGGGMLCPGCVDAESMERDVYHWQQAETAVRRRMPA